MSQEQRTSRSNNTSPGIYLGKVVNHLDTQYMGSIEVELLKRSASGNSNNYVQCRYASPFYGQTPFEGVTRNDGYDYTQKSYGFWAVPPDVGTQVIVVMPEGDFADAYWIGCVPDTGMNFMTPGYPSTTYNTTESSKALPVGEYNKKQESGDAGDITKFVKPTNEKAVERLEQQGLKDDWVRGTNTSSARREVPSMVFGWSTPGPYDWDGPTHRYGKSGAQANVPFSRLGGSSFVMDDGDAYLVRKKPAGGDDGDKPEYVQPESGDTSGDKSLPANELVRIKTRSGHQILLHNTEDLIYIAHGSGNSWIEMTANGKIDVYAKDSISVHSENDINFSADRDINFRAGNNVNIVSDNNVQIRAAANYEIRADADGNLFCGGQSSIKAATHAESADGGIFMNSSTAASEAAEAPIPKRVPQHEPWPEHEHLDPQKFIPDETEATETEDGAETQDPPFPTIPDTFKRAT